MWKRFLVVFFAAATIFGNVNACAQDILTFSSGGLKRIRSEQIEMQIKRPFDLMAITLPPEKNLGVLFLDGQPLQPYHWISKEQADRIMLFSTRKEKVITFGIMVPDLPHKTFKILCINRK